MATIREDRAAAINKLNRMFGDDFKAAAMALLDRLDEIDRDHPPAGYVTVTVSQDEAIAAWIEANPEAFEAWAQKRNLIGGGSPARTAPPRGRATARKAAPQ